MNETAATKYAQLLARGNILNRFVTINGGTDDNYQATLEHIFGLGSYADFASVDLLDLDIVTGQSMLDLNSPNPPEPSYGKILFSSIAYP